MEQGWRRTRFLPCACACAPRHARHSREHPWVAVGTARALLLCAELLERLRARRRARAGGGATALRVGACQRRCRAARRRVPAARQRHSVARGSTRRERADANHEGACTPTPPAGAGHWPQAQAAHPLARRACARAPSRCAARSRTRSTCRTCRTSRICTSRLHGGGRRGEVLRASHPGRRRSLSCAHHNATAPLRVIPLRRTALCMRIRGGGARHGGMCVYEQRRRHEA
jgi:hypothetical protein